MMLLFYDQESTSYVMFVAFMLLFHGIIVPITCNCIDQQKQQKHTLIEYQTKLIHKMSTLEPNDFAFIKIALKKIDTLNKRTISHCISN